MSGRTKEETVIKTLTSTIKAIFVTSLVLLFGIGTSVHASSFRQVTYEFEDYNDITLDWADSDDDTSTDSNALGFSVTIGGAAYSYFDMNSNGYIELLTDAGDVPTDKGPNDIDELISADPCATYLLAAYDDFNSLDYGYYGYKLFSDPDPNRAVFFYYTETFQDTGPSPSVSGAQLNNFEVILYEDGNVQWNFYYADYVWFDHDFFSGLYFGNTQTLLELTRYHIPEQKSYLYYGCDDWLTMDFNNNCFVNWADFGGNFALQWLKCAELNDPYCWQYTLTINTDGNGSVTKDPSQATYTYDTIVDVDAIADLGWTFSAWSGDLTGSTNPNSITMDANKTVTATFTEDQYALTIIANGNGSVTKTPDQADYTYGTFVDVNAIADPCWTFSAWSGDLSGSNNPETITMDANKTVTATFTDQYTLTINTAGNGSVTKTPDQATYTYGTIVDVNAIADPCWTFSAWSGDFSGSNNPDTITMDANKTVTATFTEDQNHVTLTININGNGSVTKTPDQVTFTYGTIVDVNAIADPGWTFDSWSGNLTGSTNPNSITMDGSKSITATFTEDHYTLTIIADGNGSVTKTPDQADYTYGTLVDVNAIADPCWTFLAWSGGDLSGSNNPETITMDGSKTVTATFTEGYTLTIIANGAGSVTKTPNQARYAHGTIVDVNAIAAPSWTFDSWSGDLTGSTNPNSITMDSDKTVTATFTL